MDRRTANLLQGGILVALVWFTSFDVDRPMKQQPVSQEQTAAFQQHVSSIKQLSQPRHPGL